MALAGILNACKMQLQTPSQPLRLVSLQVFMTPPYLMEIKLLPDRFTIVAFTHRRRRRH
jgi:hypothetical protein